MRSDSYRKNVYEEFAKEARKEDLDWIVLHGIEGYPESIGRDLDVYCIDKKTIFRLCELFETVAKRNNETLYVIYPNPLWGKRVLAISKCFEVAELHILYKINSGIISYIPDFNKKEYFYDFPYEEEATEFKAIVMSLLGSNIKVISRMEQFGINKYNLVLQKAYRHLKENDRINKFDKLRIYIYYSKSISQVIKSMCYSLKVKKERENSSTVPIFEFINYTDSQFELLKEIIFELFNDYHCGDNLTYKQMIYYTARQEFVYLKKHNTDCVDITYEIDLADVNNAAIKILNLFAKYNKDNKYAMFE